MTVSRREVSMWGTREGVSLIYTIVMCYQIQGL